MSELKPIKVWGQIGPNPPKVIIALNELGLSYEQDASFNSHTDVKKPEYLAVNPNGRVPAIYDPNTDLTLWESCAILEYLAERYDTSNKFSFAAGTAESAILKVFLYFQASGQGPYYGQAAWFKKFHAEPVPSAVDRYVKEVNRVTSVLEGHLAQQKPGAGGPWLVGGKYTIADMAWVSWQEIIGKFCTKEEYNLADYPHVAEWMAKLTSRKAIRSALDAAVPPK